LLVEQVVVFLVVEVVQEVIELLVLDQVLLEDQH
jgi:hypothetical protein